MIYIIVFFSTVLFILLFAAITVFCFGLKKMYIAKSQHSEASAQRSQRDSMRASALAAAAAGRPQLEDDSSLNQPPPLASSPPPDNIEIEKPDGSKRKFRGFGRKKKD